MVNTYLIVDAAVTAKFNYFEVDEVLTAIQSKTGHPDQKIGLFVICTHSKRWREGKWKNKEGLNYAIRVPREAVDTMSREEVTAWVIELAKKELKWEQAATAA